MREFVADLKVEGLPPLRYAERLIQEKPTDIGYACLVGNKSIRIFPNNRVEISEIEFLERDEANGHETMISFVETPSWVTHYPERLNLETVKASLDYAYIHAGLPSLFYLTNLSLMVFESREDERRAALSAFKTLYPGLEPWLTELNPMLEQYARDLFYQSHPDARV